MPDDRNMEENNSTVMLPRLPALALQPREDVTKSSKQGYQWPHKKSYDLHKFKKKRNTNPSSISEKPSQFKPEVDLIESIFANYNKQARPVWNTTKAVDVQLRLTVTNILGIVCIVSSWYIKP